MKTLLLCVSILVAVKGFTAPSCVSWRTGTALLDSKWDDLVDEDEEPHIPFDMKYVPRNVRRQHQNFCDIREIGGAELTNDIYVREPGNQVFWFAGKVARVSDVSLEQCVARQWPLIAQHAANLRPIELFPKRGTLELWTAPGDSEMDVAYNRPELVMRKMAYDGVEGADEINKVTVGFQGETYEAGEDGFRTWRTEDGRAAKPEVVGGEEDEGAPNQAGIDELIQKMEGMDVQDMYKEQERREGRQVED